MKRPHLLIYATWAVYLLAWFLPVHKHGVRFPEGLPGWQALMIALNPLWNADHWSADRWGFSILMILSGFTNLLMVASMFPIIRRSTRSLARLGWTTVAAVAINAHWLIHSDLWSDLRIGYYLWWLSFAFLARDVYTLRSQKAADASGS